MINAFRHPEQLKYILIGTGIYFLFIVLVLVTWPLIPAILPPSSEIFLLLFLAFLTIPAIVSSFFVSYWSKDQLLGLFGVICAGFIILIMICCFLSVLAIDVIVMPQPHYATQPPPILFLFLFTFVSFMAFSYIGIASVVLAMLSGRIGSKLSKKGTITI
ncbi:MAG: hypothetical protein ACXAEU_25835 [Candidatus Hodarchaeales archaeon]